MSRTHTVVPSPIGPLTVVRDQDGALVRLAMSPPRALEADALGARADAGFEDVARQLAEYFAGERTAFRLPLRPVGSRFELAVWDQLTRIPYGETRSYGHVAEAVGEPGGAQAVGAANGRNPIAIVVPCHRVVGADGRLVGFGGGLPRKRFLLDLEQRADRLF
ncbi:methylated-DNA-[protein]-cysteine S-methyltransferase [Geodermatophilus siccatus]|uniref:Methylated-DNA--protein-cysteine methyltransferase n=1 Tax=Geodermatophilus siccatus TaxID=1137991 RepID=A0A1G9PPP7_9ACTN|nr:methylated-DNA--[protein]-cysteine S-methyltransferase [Geodermatophilus siccatus]SDM00217.1 methylated-DNA-[protein]-cysteine S-methyltransferase [Geodermatophilus siccatus]